MARHHVRGLAAALSTTSLLALSPAMAEPAGPYFERLATWPVFLNLPQGVDPASETVAEITAATPDGMTLVYTDSPGERIGFVGIEDPAAPVPGGVLEMGGEPTSVTVVAGTVLVGVNISESYASPSGHVAVVDLATKAVAATCDVGGQPDSVAASPDGRFLAVAVENERDEDTNDGQLPQAPAGHLAILDLGADGRPTNCDAARIVQLTGLASVAGEDPEPEYVDINTAGEAVVTLQENNHIVIVDLAAGTVTGHFSAGAVDLEKIDADDDKIIAGTGAKQGVLREPDSAVWLGTDRFVTANEGDYEGGSRGFTVFDRTGKVVFEAGNALEHAAMSLGHYPVKRAKSKGVEPEGADAGSFGGSQLFFVGSERGNFVAVFEDQGPEAAPRLLQVLPTAVGPEGLLAIPGRDLFVVSTEVDSAEDNVRGTIGIYRRGAAAPFYPTLVSETDPATGAPIGWGVISGAIADPAQAAGLIAVSDSYYGVSRIFTIDASASPARIAGYVDLKKDGAPAAYDLEGIAVRAGGGYWLASEGNPESKNPLTTQSLLLKVAADGTVEEEIALPESLAAQAIRFGFEGVAAWGEGEAEKVIVAVQRAWKDDPENMAKLAIYTPATKSWSFVRYPLEAPKSANGGWVGLSEITHLGGERFAVLERDNQPGVHGVIKTITLISLEGVEPKPHGETLPVVEKKLAIDLLPEMLKTGGWISDKPESFAVLGNGQLIAITDNDGVDGASGETQLLHLGTADRLN